MGSSIQRLTHCAYYAASQQMICCVHASEFWNPVLSLQFSYCADYAAQRCAAATLEQDRCAAFARECRQ